MIIFRKSKPSALNANLLKVVNRSVPSSASEGKKKKDALADVVEKADGKRKKDKKEAEKDLDKFCKPGEWNDTPTSFCHFIGQNWSRGVFPRILYVRLSQRYNGPAKYACQSVSQFGTNKNSRTCTRLISKLSLSVPCAQQPCKHLNFVTKLIWKVLRDLLLIKRCFKEEF